MINDPHMYEEPATSLSRSSGRTHANLKICKESEKTEFSLVSVSGTDLGGMSQILIIHLDFLLSLPYHKDKVLILWKEILY